MESGPSNFNLATISLRFVGGSITTIRFSSEQLVVMNHSTRLRIARAVRFLKPTPQKIPLSIDQVLGRSESLDIVKRFNKLATTMEVWAAR